MSHVFMVAQDYMFFSDKIENWIVIIDVKGLKFNNSMTKVIKKNKQKYKIKLTQNNLLVYRFVIVQVPIVLSQLPIQTVFVQRVQNPQSLPLTGLWQLIKSKKIATIIKQVLIKQGIRNQIQLLFEDKQQKSLLDLIQLSELEERFGGSLQEPTNKWPPQRREVIISKNAQDSTPSSKRELPSPQEYVKHVPLIQSAYASPRQSSPQFSSPVQSFSQSIISPRALQEKIYSGEEESGSPSRFSFSARKSLVFSQRSSHRSIDESKFKIPTSPEHSSIRHSLFPLEYNQPLVSSYSGRQSLVSSQPSNIKKPQIKSSQVELASFNPKNYEEYPELEEDKVWQKIENIKKQDEAPQRPKTPPNKSGAEELDSDGLKICGIF